MPTPDATSHATPNGTRGFADRHGALGPEAFRSLGSTGLLVSGVGFGCHRIDADHAEHAASLRDALRMGCNLLDTSATNGDGASERVVGQVLRAMIAEGTVAREEVVVVSQIGSVQGGHWIQPDVLSEQLGSSLARLGLDALDACLLHEPEHDRPERRAEFERRIHAAFARMEDECDAGRIRFYGVSSDAFVKPADDEDATSLTRMLEIAREVAEQRGSAPDAHRFRADKKIAAKALQ